MQNYDAMELAKREVDKFDPVLHDHAQAMECQDCEADIQHGISSLASLELANDDAFEQMECGKMPLEQYIQMQEVIYTLHKLWIAKSEFLLRKAAKHQTDGFEVVKFAELTECYTRAKEWLRVADGIRANTA